MTPVETVTAGGTRVHRRPARNRFPRNTPPARDQNIDLSASATLPLVADPRGEAILALPIPNNPTLVGVRANLQAATTAPCGQLRAAASAGLELTVLK